MDRKELETYQVQLSQVELAIASDPDNTELTSLRSELQELITLTEAALAEQDAALAAASSKSSKSSNNQTAAALNAKAWSAGDECLARYSGDNQWYPARITSIGGAEDRRVYSVVFKGYNSTELLNASALKPLPPSSANSALPSTLSNKRKLSKEEEEEAARKKKKNEKRNEVRTQKAKEQTQKQAAWQKFAKKSEKKGTVIPGLQGKSIFQSPANPHGKVGVTGSGKGMSDAVTRIKHKFGEGEDQ